MAGNLRDDPHYIMLDNHDISCFDHGTYDLIQLLTMAQNMGKFTAVEVFFFSRHDDQHSGCFLPISRIERSSSIHVMGIYPLISKHRP